jgi:hypothetical protein
MISESVGLAQVAETEPARQDYRAAIGTMMG